MSINKKRERRFFSLSNELIKKSQESALAAIQVFNNPLITFKSESFIVLMNIAWTYLMHSYYRKEGTEYRYYDQQSKRKKFHKTKYGADKFWDLERCLNYESCPLSEPIKDNIKFLIGIRHEIEHQMTSKIDDSISAKFQACCINYNKSIKELFGNDFGLDKTIPVALQLFTFEEDQVSQLKLAPNLPRNLVNFISDFENGLDSKSNPLYSYRIIYTRDKVNHKNQADKAIRFIDEESSEGREIHNVLLKNVEKEKFLPGEIVKRAQNSGFSSFNMHKHTELWKQKDAKNPKNQYGVMVANHWYWYEDWMNLVLQELHNLKSKQND